jgi:hypothetical protein
MDSARVHPARATPEKLDVCRLKRTPQPPYSPDIAPSDFLFSVGWKPRLSGENIIEKMNYIKSGMKFWQVSQSKWSKGSLLTGWIDSNAWLMEMMTTFHKISPVNFWTKLNNGKHVRVEH